MGHIPDFHDDTPPTASADAAEAGSIASLSSSSPSLRRPMLGVGLLFGLGAPIPKQHDRVVFRDKGEGTVDKRSFTSGKFSEDGYSYSGGESKSSSPKVAREGGDGGKGGPIAKTTIVAGTAATSDIDDGEFSLHSDHLEQDFASEHEGDDDLLLRWSISTEEENLDTFEGHTYDHDDRGVKVSGGASGGVNGGILRDFVDADKWEGGKGGDGQATPQVRTRAQDYGGSRNGDDAATDAGADNGLKKMNSTNSWMSARSIETRLPWWQFKSAGNLSDVRDSLKNATSADTGPMRRRTIEGSRPTMEGRRATSITDSFKADDVDVLIHSMMDKRQDLTRMDRALLDDMAQHRGNNSRWEQRPLMGDPDGGAIPLNAPGAGAGDGAIPLIAPGAGAGGGAIPLIAPGAGAGGDAKTNDTNNVCAYDKTKSVEIDGLSNCSSNSRALAGGSFKSWSSKRGVGPLGVLAQASQAFLHRRASNSALELIQDYGGDECDNESERGGSGEKYNDDEEGDDAHREESGYMDSWNVAAQSVDEKSFDSPSWQNARSSGRGSDRIRISPSRAPRRNGIATGNVEGPWRNDGDQTGMPPGDDDGSSSSDDDGGGDVLGSLDPHKTSHNEENWKPEKLFPQPRKGVRPPHRNNGSSNDNHPSKRNTHWDGMSSICSSEHSGKIARTHINNGQKAPSWRNMLSFQRGVVTGPKWEDNENDHSQAGDFEADDEDDYRLEMEVFGPEDAKRAAVVAEACELATKVNRSVLAMGSEAPFRPTEEIFPPFKKVHKSLGYQMDSLGADIRGDPTKFFYRDGLPAIKKSAVTLDDIVRRSILRHMHDFQASSRSVMSSYSSASEFSSASDVGEGGGGDASQLPKMDDHKAVAAYLMSRVTTAQAAQSTNKSSQMSVLPTSFKKSRTMENQELKLYNTYLPNFLWYRFSAGDPDSTMRPTSLCSGTGISSSDQYLQPDMLEVFSMFGSYFVGAFGTYKDDDEGSVSGELLRRRTAFWVDGAKSSAIGGDTSDDESVDSLLLSSSDLLGDLPVLSQTEILEKAVEELLRKHAEAESIL